MRADRKYPITKEHVDSFVKKGRDIEQFYNHLLLVINEYKNVELLDYQLEYKNNYEYFVNLNHMNYFGAEIFSKELESDLENLGFLQN